MSAAGVGRGVGRLLAAAVSFVLLAAIAVYRALLSPLLAALTGSGCRFQPTCSVYAAESIRLNGPWRGGRLALRRLGRCHPFHPGGFDPPVHVSAAAGETSPPPREHRVEPHETQLARPRREWSGE